MPEPRHDEAYIQRCVIASIHKHSPECMVLHIPNGGSRHPIEAANLKQQGVMAGAPDLLIIPPGGVAHFLEVKTLRGFQQPNQRMFERKAQERGARYAVVRSADDVPATFSEWGLPWR